MKLGLISDIHCNLAGLERALALLDDCDEVLCAGDLMYQYRFSNELLRRLRERDVQAILGNHDKTILYSPGHPLRASPSIDPAELEYLAGLPTSLWLTRRGTRVAVFHGAPWDEERGPRAYYIYPQDAQALRRLAEVPADVIVLGHTHIPMEVRVGNRLVINAGSIGECRDGTGKLSLAVLDLDGGGAEFRYFSLNGAA